MKLYIYIYIYIYICYYLCDSICHDTPRKSCPRVPRALPCVVFCCLSKVLTAGVAGDLCRALVANGVELPSVSRVARCRQARDFETYVRDTVPLIEMVEQYKFEIPLDNPTGLGSAHRIQQMVLPHELFSVLHGNYPDQFRKMFATDRLDEWWSHIPAERRQRHSYFEDDRMATTVPLRLYGDDIAVAKTVHCLVLLFTSAAAFRLPAGEAYVPVSSTRLEGSDWRTTEEVYKVLRWSLEALCKGKWPATNHLGQPWPPGSERARLGEAGADLAGEFKAIIWEICGDWKWLAEAIGFKQQRRYYLCKEICHKCGARTAGAIEFPWSRLLGALLLPAAVDAELPPGGGLGTVEASRVRRPG